MKENLTSSSPIEIPYYSSGFEVACMEQGKRVDKGKRGTYQEIVISYTS